MLYECLAGAPPFRRETEVATLYAHLEDPPPVPSTKVETTPLALDQVVAKAMAKRPEERFATAEELGTAVRVWSGTLPGRVLSDRTLVSRRRAWLAAGAFLVLAAGTIVALWAARGNSPAPKAAGPPAAVARIDNTSGRVTTQAHDRHWGWHLVVAEGALWQTGPEGLVKRDETTGDVEKIFELDGQTHTVAAGFGSIWVTVAPAANQATLVQIAPATDEVVDSVEVDPSSGGSTGIVWVAVGRDAVWVYNGNGDLWKIDPISTKILARDRVATEGGGIAIGGGAVWVSDILRDEVVKLDESDGKKLATIPMTGEPDWLAFVGRAVWAQNFAAGTITPIDALNLKAGASIAAPDGQANEAAGSGGLWIAADGVISVIDPATRDITLEIPIGFPASSVAIDERTGAIWALHRPVVWAPGP